MNLIALKWSTHLHDLNLGLFYNEKTYNNLVFFCIPVPFMCKFCLPYIAHNSCRWCVQRWCCDVWAKHLQKVIVKHKLLWYLSRIVNPQSLNLFSFFISIEYWCRKKGAPREVKGRLCGQRTNAGRIIKESYGTAKQQHTFTVSPWFFYEHASFLWLQYS